MSHNQDLYEFELDFLKQNEKKPDDDENTLPSKDSAVANEAIELKFVTIWPQVVKQVMFWMQNVAQVPLNLFNELQAKIKRPNNFNIQKYNN